VNPRRVAALAAKEWREILRDRIFFILAFIVPFLWMLVFGYGLILDVENVPFAVVDHDRTALSRDYAYRFIASRFFDFKGYLRDAGEADALLADNRIRLALVIPEHFQHRLLEGRPATVQTLIDGTFPFRAQTTKGYVIAITGAASADRLAEHLARKTGVPIETSRRQLEPVRMEVRYLYNQKLRSDWSIAPALIMFVLIISPPLLTALSVVREKESGAIYNIYSSTVTRGEFLAGKLLPNVALSTVIAALLWSMATGLFGAPFKGSLAFWFAVTVLYVTCTCSIGLVVSLLVRTQAAALIVTVILTIVPTVIYSGMLIPVSSLSPSGQLEAHLFAGMYYTDVVLGTFLKGVGLDVLWPDVLALAAYATLLLAAGYLMFRKRPRA
jgi:drug efflux transport system permease protein